VFTGLREGGVGLGVL
jgi:hypothetical protein